MKIAIHHRPGSYSEQWIVYCEEKLIPFKIVNCYDSDIVEQLDDCDILMWHHHHHDYRDALFAKQLLFSLEKSGKNIYPDFDTTWHFDDKVGQKYLLEAINAPVIPTYVFYDKESAKKWAMETAYPKVFKLRGGSGSRNVALVKSKGEALNKINKAFGKGFSQFNRWENLRERYRRFKSGKDSYIGLLKGVARLFIPTEFSAMHSREKGYIYFQDFMPNNDYDIRLIVIQNKAYGMKRMNRKGDFRASGSSQFVYDSIPNNVLEIGFNVAKQLGLQSIAFDFVFNDKLEPVIVEMSYAFGTEGSSKCKGYWTEDLVFHEGILSPQNWMLENLLERNAN